MDPTPSAPVHSVSDADFRSAMASFAAGVTVVTALDESGRPWGLTVSAFSSLSRDPPLCLICIDRRSGSAEAITRTRRFAVNVLSSLQQEVSARFASKIDDKFDGVPWTAGTATGCPLLEGALASIECEVADVLPGGDHHVFVGALRSVAVHPGLPLVYFRGAYSDVTPRPKR